MATTNITENELIAENELIEKWVAQVRSELVETDGEPLESPWHRAAIALLIEVIVWLYRGRTDYFVGGNMFIYYSMAQVRNREYRGPDFFFVKNVDGARERLVWWAFEEDRFPNVIIELMSPSTAKEDLTIKKAIYQDRFETPEYFCYDPQTQRLYGWRLDATKHYQPIAPNERGWLWSEELQLFLGLWDGVYLEKAATWPRFFDHQDQLLPIKAEAEAQHAEAEGQRADAERQRADAEAQEAAAAKAELARLQAWFKQHGIAQPNGPQGTPPPDSSP